MASDKQTVVIVGTGNIAQYMLESFLSDGTYNVIIISRTDRNFFHRPGVALQVMKEYCESEITPILDASKATAIISTLTCADTVIYTAMHKALLDACTKSQTCKRLIPSEFLGDLRDFGQFPRGSYAARNDFRQMIKSQSDVKWTMVCQGWLGDYFVQPADGSKSYIRPFPQGWPISLDQTAARVLGTGDEPIGWTATRDMTDAVAKLMAHQDWPEYTYVFGELGTWNEAITKVEKFLGRTLKRTHVGKEEIIASCEQRDDAKKQYTATIDEWSIVGATAAPREEALQQREKYFKGVRFRTIDELLEESKHVQII